MLYTAYPFPQHWLLTRPVGCPGLRLFPNSAVLQVEPNIFLQVEQLLPAGLASCGQACCLFCLRQDILCPLSCPLSAPVSQQFLIKGILIFCVLPSLWGAGVGGMAQVLVGSHSILEPIAEQYLWHPVVGTLGQPLLPSGPAGQWSAPSLGSLRALSGHIGTSSHSPKGPLLVL